MENSKLPTLEEILVKHKVLKEPDLKSNFNLRLTRDCYTGTVSHIKEAMLEFGRMHVKAALEEADGEVPLYCSEGVLNCYPPERIK